ncbi:antitermination protein [Aeromonas hydrophila]|uniref:antitermination protein Q n=1 Tax=Aeromonas hydrophila TaxID=644 RepID=UPI0035A35A5A
MRIEHVITAGWARASLNEAHHSGYGQGEAGVGSLGAFALLGKYCPTGLALLLARYNKDPGQRLQALGEVIATGRTLAPTYLTKLAHRADGAAIIAAATLALDAYCRTADTPGAACQCKGRGVRLARDTSGERPCERCRGTGLRPITGARVRRALTLCLGEVTRNDWESRWYPFYLALVAWCHEQEAEATNLLRRLG